MNTCKLHQLVHILYEVQECCGWMRLVVVFLVINCGGRGQRLKWTNFHQHYGLVCSRVYD